jgi:hypothetical protein
MLNAEPTNQYVPQTLLSFLRWPHRWTQYQTPKNITGIYRTLTISRDGEISRYWQTEVDCLKGKRLYGGGGVTLFGWLYENRTQNGYYKVNDQLIA